MACRAGVSRQTEPPNFIPHSPPILPSQLDVLGSGDAARRHRVGGSTSWLPVGSPPGTFGRAVASDGCFGCDRGARGFIDSRYSAQRRILPGTIGRHWAQESGGNGETAGR